MELLDPFWIEDVERSRLQTPEEKLRLGGELFDAACEVALAGIRSQFPGISAEKAIDVLRQRLDFARRMENAL